jgi:ABC-type multidrug transport system fused ATPase/permease subunit
MRPLNQISVGINLYSSALAAADRIFEMIDMPAGVSEKENPKPFDRFKQSIEIRDLSFRYPGNERWALEDINLSVKNGMSISLVGSSGAGKSTLMDMMMRFYDPDQGCIIIDGIDIRDMSINDLRRSIGMVTQNIFLFNATVRDNIAYGRRDIPESKIMEIAKAANAHDFILKLPEGYDTQIGERGVMLSGGQKQRIAIARALLLDPPILIFDEATSSLDNESEMLVRQAMDRLLAGRTVFIIAHRLSSVYNSDLILVLDGGRIAERGTHRELITHGGIYKKLFDMQFSEESRRGS